MALAQRQVLVDCLIAIVREKKLNAGTTAKAVAAGSGSPSVRP
jgi:ketol-acid reductoisomerase